MNPYLPNLLLAIVFYYSNSNPDQDTGEKQMSVKFRYPKYFNVVHMVTTLEGNAINLYICVNL